MPFGITLLVLIPANILKVAAGLIIAVFVLLNYYGLKFRTSRDKTASTIAGVSGGLLYGSIGVPGPPVILFLVNQDCEKHALRATTSAFLALIGSISIPGYFMANLLTTEVIKYVSILIIPAVLGLYIGSRLIHKADETIFKKIVLLVLIVMSIIIIISGLGLFSR